MVKLKCIYCNKNDFDEGKGSREHVILSSLGGRKMSRNICCVVCNNQLGEAIDEPTSKDLVALSNSAGITTGRDKESPTIKNVAMIEGQSLDLKSGGKPDRSLTD
ncbi:HNH endonuclease [Desulfonatronum thiodismutans]|uniref:HNH endonuclease n=1 Tax=Desulfonatronum thiodismutans TaxID=159290 RepID=UPI000A00CD09|nr:HNH endonuclease [Desulfonatronum thiodismutans]